MASIRTEVWYATMIFALWWCEWNSYYMFTWKKLDIPNRHILISTSNHVIPLKYIDLQEVGRGEVLEMLTILYPM